MNVFIHQIFVWFWDYKHNLTFIWVFKKKIHGKYSNKFEYLNIYKKNIYISIRWGILPSVLTFPQVRQAAGPPCSLLRGVRREGALQV